MSNQWQTDECRVVAHIWWSCAILGMVIAICVALYNIRSEEIEAGLVRDGLKARISAGQAPSVNGADKTAPTGK